jgi:hypothetical protein
VCTENLVRIDLMRESLNVDHDGRADISLRAGILPFALVVLPLWATVRAGTIVAAITDSVISIVSITLLVVVASRLYERLGNRVNQPAMA